MNAIKAKNIFLTLFSSYLGIGACLCLVIFAFGNEDLGGLFIAFGIIIMIAAVIYPIIVFSQMAREINVMCRDDGEQLMPYIAAYFLGCITLGIYLIYYYYRMQTRMHEKAYRYGVQVSESGGTIVLWWLVLLILLGLGPIISLAIIIKSFNKMAYGYNKQLDLGATDVVFQETGTPGTLSCIAGEIVGASITIEDGDTIIIGRDKSISNVILEDSKISRKHCSITYDARMGEYYITDYSSNGTSLGDGTKLVKGVSTSIQKGTEIVLTKNTKFAVS